MEIHAIPVAQGFLIYRPLRQLAFIGNGALVRYVRDRAQGVSRPLLPEVESLLDALAFWEPDPPTPAEWLPTPPHQPTGAVLLMTGRCNLRCTYCYARGGDFPDLNLSWDLARTVIDAAHANARSRAQPGFTLSLHGGGEPSLNWDVLTAAVEYAKSRELPCRIALVSNGVWSDAQREYLLKHIDDLTISFDGVQVVQDRQRPRVDGGGSFDMVMASIRAADAARLRYGVRITATPSSFERLPESVELICATTGCQSINVEPAYGLDRGVAADPTPADGEAFAKAFIDAFWIASKARRSLQYSGARPGFITASFCRAPEDSLIVTPEGDLVGCYEVVGRRHPLSKPLCIGRVTPGQVLVNFAQVQAFADSQRMRRQACRECFAFWQCSGDCASRRLSSSTNNEGRCAANRRITQEILCSWVAAGDGVFKGSAPPPIAQPAC